MKILLLTNMYPSEQAPNYGVFVQRTETILKEAGHQIVLVALTKKYSFFRKLLGYFFYVLSFLLKTHVTKPDVIYVHYASQNAKLILLMKKWKPNIPIILNTHGTDILPQSIAQEKYQPDVHKMMQIIDHVIVPSTYYEKVVIEKYKYNGPISLFPSGGVNTEFFKPNAQSGAAYKKENQLPEDKIIISYISRVDAHKGWDTLIESIAILKYNNPAIYEQLHFLIAGSGSQDQNLLSKVNENDLSKVITRKPMLSQTEMVEALNASDVFCFPSVQESLGLVGLEAMSCGLPLIASDIPGTKDYVNERNAITFETNNANDLANAIITYINMSTAEKELFSKEARETALRFDTKKVSQMLKIVFEKQKPSIESE